MATREFFFQLIITFVSDTSIPQFQTSIGLEPTQVDEYESDLESEFRENEDEALRGYPITKLSATRSGR